MLRMSSRGTAQTKPSGENKTTSKTSSLKALLLKAWRERWTDLQWGIHIKTVLPRGVSGDVYDLADCILQQAVVGNGANQLVLSYLKHTLSSQLVSYSAVLLQISKCGMQQLNKPHCTVSLLDFLESVQSGITCRAKSEENALPTSIFNISHWLLNIIHHYMTVNELNNFEPKQTLELIDKPAAILDGFIKDNFFLSVLYLAKFENSETYLEIQSRCKDIQMLLKTINILESSTKRVEYIIQVFSNLQIDAIFPNNEKPESITYCIQSLLTIQVFSNPCNDIKSIVSQLLMIRRIKGYSMPRLYCELIRACFYSLNYISGDSEESTWGGFTFLTLPHILQYLVNLNKDAKKTGYSQDVIEAFEMLLQYTPLLDVMDTKCSCNSLECLLNELLKLKLVTETHCKYFSSKRESVLNNLPKIDPSTTTRASIPKIMVSSAEPSLAGLLKTLDSDYLKTQEALLSMLLQVLTGKSFELILAIATVGGKLKTFVSKLIKFNEQSKQPMTTPESPKSAQTRAMLFDITFLMLCWIVLRYRSKNVLDEDGDSFFEKWVRLCMVERDVPKSPDQIIKLCDQSKVDALIKQLNTTDPTGDFKNGQTKWHEVCLNTAGVIKEILCAWEKDAIGAGEVKRVLDALRGGGGKAGVPSSAPSAVWTGGCCSLAVCASAWLCAHIRLVDHDALLKPMNMIQQLGSPMIGNADLMTGSDDSKQQQEIFKEKSLLMSQIIRKFQYHDINAGSGCARNKPPSGMVSTITQLKQIFEEICTQGSITNSENCTVLENLLRVAGTRNFVQSITQELIKLRFLEDLNKAVDLAFAIFHLDIEHCTITLLADVLPLYLFNHAQSEQLVEPQTFALAKLSIYCIVALVDSYNIDNANYWNSKKRPRSDNDSDDDDSLPASKLLRLNECGDSNPGNPSSTSSKDNGITDLLTTNLTSKFGTTQSRQVIIKPNLQQALTNLYKDFLSIMTSEAYIENHVYFICDFLKACVTYSNEIACVILKTLPSNLIPCLLKCLPECFTYDLLLRLYDLSTQGTFICNSSRDLVARDLCLLRNIMLKKENVLSRRKHILPKTMHLTTTQTAQELIEIQAINEDSVAEIKRWRINRVPTNGVPSTNCFIKLNDNIVITPKTLTEIVNFYNETVRFDCKHADNERNYDTNQKRKNDIAEGDSDGTEQVDLSEPSKLSSAQGALVLSTVEAALPKRMVVYNLSLSSAQPINKDIGSRFKATCREQWTLVPEEINLEDRERVCSDVLFGKAIVTTKKAVDLAIQKYSRKVRHLCKKRSSRRR